MMLLKPDMLNLCAGKLSQQHLAKKNLLNCRNDFRGIRFLLVPKMCQLLVTKSIAGRCSGLKSHNLNIYRDTRIRKTIEF